jgi:hypothetical protein
MQLLAYNNTTDLCIPILYSATLLNLFIGFDTFYIQSVFS